MSTETPSPRTLGQTIRQRRIDLGLTQEQLAERVGGGVRQAEISRLEHDRIALPRQPRMVQLAAALGLSVGELLARSGWAGAEASFEPAETPLARTDVDAADDDSRSSADEPVQAYATPSDRDLPEATILLSAAISQSASLIRQTEAVLHRSHENLGLLGTRLSARVERPCRNG